MTLKGADDKVLGTFKYNHSNKTLTPVTAESQHMSVLKVRIIGKFEGAMVNQRKYDAISGATGSVSSNNNSDVIVQVAEVVPEDDVPEESAWKKAHESGLRFNPAESRAFLDERSGMKGLYSGVSSRLSLSGTPDEPGGEDP